MSHVPKVDAARKYFEGKVADETSGKPISKDELNKKIRKDYVSDDSNDYDISDDTELDDREW